MKQPYSGFSSECCLTDNTDYNNVGYHILLQYLRLSDDGDGSAVDSNSPTADKPALPQCQTIPGYCIDYRGSVQCAYPLQQGTGERCRDICNACARCGTVQAALFFTFIVLILFSFTIRFAGKYFCDTSARHCFFVGLYLFNDTSIS